jgi:hypothetical protein
MLKKTTPCTREALGYYGAARAAGVHGWLNSPSD